MPKDLVARTLQMQAARERLDERCEALHSELVRHATAHAKALDPSGKKYLRSRIPGVANMQVSVDQQAGTVTLSGTVWRGGETDTEEYTMPLEYAAGTVDRAEYLRRITQREVDRQQAEAAAAARLAEATRNRELAQLAALRAKYPDA